MTQVVPRFTWLISVLATLSVGCAPAQTRPVAPRPEGTTVTSEDLRNSNESIEVALQRKVPGLVVTRTDDGGIALQIRGRSSLTETSQTPLYVMDGLPFHPGPGGALTGVNPSDIESIKVLKGAEAGLYGSDGANGVILITTKRGVKKSKP
jgi:TonB-dependent SusC/RagA subfamily outer membrane receptor